uniref:Retrovirus-related Pol polyprotein from transposon TNT 1-94-like beta-barrel domain-containing protein n=1 Tax=Chenopodium quinoa TaxID=63459 RepID=A0A803LYH3_CHEQI
MFNKGSRSPLGGASSGGAPLGGGGVGRGFATSSRGGCTACGKSSHVTENCRTLVGYPHWHPKHQQKPSGFAPQKGKAKFTLGNSKWGGKNRNVNNRSAANVTSNQGESGGSSTSSSNQFTTQHIEALMRMLPRQTLGDGDDETKSSYACMVSCHFAESIGNEWIIDSGASDHMTGYLNTMHDVVKSKNNPQINLPIGQTTTISHFGNVNLGNKLTLKYVLYVPSFKHNLISVNKLMCDSHSIVLFYPKYCNTQDLEFNIVKGIGRMKFGLYYLENRPLETVVNQLKTQIFRKDLSAGKMAMNVNTYMSIPTVVTNVLKLSNRTLWHHRLGHAPMKRIEKIHELKGMNEGRGEVYLTCPLAKFTKLPYDVSESRAEEAFELIHIDTWGPHRVCTKGKSDNAPEFEDQICRPLYEKLGIVHQTSCVGRPQQNGRAERKHKNILEMGRAIRSPYEVLSNKRPAYGELRTFGCLAMASNPSLSHEKLDAREM